MADFKSKEKIARDVKGGWSPFTKIFIAVACIILFGVVIQAVRENRTTISESEAAKSRQHLEEAKKAMNAGRIVEAKYHLDAMNKFSEEWNSEGKTLWDKISTFITEERKAAERQKKEQTITLRKEFAKTYEKELLNHWLDAYVATSGELDDVLHIKHISINRPFVYKFSQNSELLKNLHQLGFSKVVLTDGYQFEETVYPH